MRTESTRNDDRTNTSHSQDGRKMLWGEEVFGWLTNHDEQAPHRQNSHQPSTDVLSITMGCVRYYILLGTKRESWADGRASLGGGGEGRRTGDDPDCSCDWGGAAAGQAAGRAYFHWDFFFSQWTPPFSTNNDFRTLQLMCYKLRKHEDSTGEISARRP